jgi:hypothetical protein
LFLAVSILSMLGIGATDAVAQIPVNDSCAGALVIPSLPYSHSQNTRLATPNPGDPPLLCADSGGGKSVWYTYTPASTQYILFSTTKSTPTDYDIALGLYTGSCGALVQVECADDSIPGSARAAVLGYNVQSGITYYLQIAEWNGGGPSGGVPTGGDLVLEVYPWAAQPLTRLPKNGSVTGGDSTVLVNLGINTFRPDPGAGEEIEEINREQVMLPTPDDVMPPLAPAGSNLTKDRTVQNVATPPSAYPVIWKEFLGNTPTGFIPPDPIMAVGPNHVIGSVNSAFGVWDKDGNLLETRNMSAWFSDVVSPVGFSDPQVLYDHYANRWIVAGGNFSPPYTFLISVSDDSDPFGTWYNWSLPAGLGDSVTGNLPDYPQIGYDSLAIYITSREFGASFLYSRCRIIDKTQLYGNYAGPVSWTDFWDFREPDHTWIPLDGMRPSIMYGGTGEHYLVNASPYSVGTFFTIWTIQDPIGTPSITAMNVPVVEYAPAPNASQLGGGVVLEAGGSAIRHKAVYRDSSLWMAHSIASGPGGAYSAARYVRINPHTGANLEDVALASDGYWYSYPALMADADKNVVVTYTRSGVTEYPGAFVAGHRDADPPGLIPNIIPLAAGQNHYEIVGGGRNRWGDYMGAGLDPSDSLAIWVNSEYALNSGNWATRFGKIKFTLYPGAKLQTDADSFAFGSHEVGFPSDTMMFFIANDGDDTLVISSIDLPDSNYHLVAAPSLPHSLQSYQVDTVRVHFVPEAVGVFNDSIVFNTNDTSRPAFAVKVSGQGFIVEPAVSGTTYLGSGTGDAGRLRTVNPVDAATAIKGASGYTQLIGLRVNETTGDLLGLAINSATVAAKADIVRVNSATGDAHVISTIDLSLLKGMAIREDTVYVGRINGSLYRVDIPTGTPTLISSGGPAIAGLDFNPLTGELWASVRSGSPIDGLYKIALPSGAATLVGTTGLGVQTTDIAFDAAGNLFGLVGTGATQSELVLIDTLTGGGTKIGSLGLTTAQALEFHPDVANFANSYHLFKKWNLITLPLEVPDRTPAGVFPPALLDSRAFAFDGGYVPVDTFRSLTAYWVKMSATKAHSIIGEPDSTDSVPLAARWNLVGTNSFIAPISSLSTAPPAIIMTQFYAYDDTGYVIADSLLPGRGYWVRASAAGTLSLNVPNAVPQGSPKASAKESLEALSSLRVEDGSGHSQTLRFGLREPGSPPAGLFELPPVPPDAGFDARFGSGSMVGYTDAAAEADGSLPVRIFSDRYPVTIRWDVRDDSRATYALVYPRGGDAPDVVVPISGTGGRTLTEVQARGLRLAMETKEVPREFALAQNYPNPFNPTTTVEYAIPTSERVRLVLYSALGEEVATLVDAQQEPGFYTAVVSGERLASGVYFYRLTAGSYTSARKMLLLR